MYEIKFVEMGCTCSSNEREAEEVYKYFGGTVYRKAIVMKTNKI
jgi:hypothetical protein